MTSKQANLIKDAYFQLSGYVPIDQQRQVHESSARHRVLIAGRRFGKSMLAAKEASPFLCNPSIPNYRIWIIAPHHETTDKVYREIWDDLIIKGYIKRSDIAKKSWTDQNRIIRTAWGSEIIGKTASNVDSLVGEEVDGIIFDEAAKCKQLVWAKYLNPTLLDRKGWALFLTTPEGRNWVHDKYKMGLSDEYPDWESFHFTSYARPEWMIRNGIDVEKAQDLIDYINEKKRELPESLFRQEYLGDFDTFFGQVYKDFDRSTHVINKLPVKFDGYFAGLDYGFKNPSVFVLIGINDGSYYVIDEIHKTGLTSEALSREIKEVLARHKLLFRQVLIYADHEPAQTKTLQNAGLCVINGKKDVKAGINKVAEKMKLQADGKPLLLFYSQCKDTIKEHENYHYAESKGTQNDKEEPVKDHDHSCDAVRYAIYTKETLPKIRTGRIRGIN